MNNEEALQIVGAVTILIVGFAVVVIDMPPLLLLLSPFTGVGRR